MSAGVGGEGAECGGGTGQLSGGVFLSRGLMNRLSATELGGGVGDEARGLFFGLVEVIHDLVFVLGGAYVVAHHLGAKMVEFSNEVIRGVEQLLHLALVGLSEHSLTLVGEERIVLTHGVEQLLRVYFAERPS